MSLALPRMTQVLKLQSNGAVRQKKDERVQRLYF